jgi:hypothetical protein
VSDELWEKTCPLYGTEHDSHWIRSEDLFGPHRKRCFGWHAMAARDITKTQARFHAPYLRGTQSNLIHRSTHEGYLVWFPEQWYAYGPARIAMWYIKPVCSLPAIKNAFSLTTDEVRKQEIYDAVWVTRVHPVITLCGKCFPINQERTSHPLAK